MDTVFEHIAIEHVGDVTIVTFAEQNLVEQIQLLELRYELHQLARFTKILLDWSGVHCASSPIMAPVLELQKRARATHSLVRMCCMHEAILKDWRVTNIVPGFIEHYGNRADALAAFAK